MQIVTDVGFGNSGSLAGPWSNLDILSLSALLLFSPSNPLSHPLRPLFIDWFSVSVYVDSDPFRPILSLKRQTKLPLKPRKYTIVTQCSVKCVTKARRQLRHYYKQRFKNLVMWLLPCARTHTHTFVYMFGPYDTSRRIIYCHFHWHQSQNSMGHIEFNQRVNV